MQRIDKYPAKVQRGLQIINDSFNNDDSILDEKIKLPIAALRAVGFAAKYGSAGRPDNQRSQAPWIDIWSPIALQTYTEKLASVPDEWWMDYNNPEYKEFADKARRANLEARAKLLELLEEFYKDRYTPASTRLMFDTKTGLGEFRLQCQGAEVAGIPERVAAYPKWLRNAQAEMNVFAEFLCSKVQ
jgi:hypothetical protein